MSLSFSNSFSVLIQYNISPEIVVLVTSNVQAPKKWFSHPFPCLMQLCSNAVMVLGFVGGNIKDKHCFRVWRGFEGQNAHQIRKEKKRQLPCQILSLRKHEWSRFLNSKESFHHKAIHSFSCFCSYSILRLQGTYEWAWYLQQLYKVTAVGIFKMASNDPPPPCTYVLLFCF